MLEALKKIDNRLLPRMDDFQYGPYIWLIYLLVFFISIVHYQPVDHTFAYAVLGSIVFLFLYFNGFWVSGNRIRINIIGIVLVGTLMSTLSPGASVFFVYAGAFCCHLGTTRKAVIGLILIAVWIGILSLVAGHGSYFYIPGVMFTFLIGGINIYQHDLSLKRKELILTQQEVRDLARTSERERIARDLHDLIGHTFSVITLKAELANKLTDKDLEKAKAEISALANISRDALSQVREVVTGYRTSDLNTELAHAKYVLESNDIQFEYRFEELELHDVVNKELAVILKELVTNILKHSEASKVRAEIFQSSNSIQMQVTDNGVGLQSSKKANQQTFEKSGYGLQGIVERVKKMQGDITIESNHGTEFKIKVPVNTNTLEE